MNISQIEKKSSLVSNDLVIFSHIPKTAGSTLNEIIEDNYQPDSIFNFYPQKQAKNTNAKNWADDFNNHRRSLNTASGLEILRGHFGFGIHEHLDIKTYTYITVLRNPVERVISNYYYFDRPSIDYKQIKEETTLASFVKEKRHKIIDNYQTRFLSGIGWQRGIYLEDLYSRKYAVKYGECTEKMLENAKENLDKYVLFGLQDRFTDTLRLFKRVLKWKDIKTNKEKNVGFNKPKREAIDRSIIQIIEQENKFDRELYEYATKTFDRQIENLQLSPKIGYTKIYWSYPSFSQNDNQKQENRSQQMAVQLGNKTKLSDSSKQNISEGDKFFDAGEYARAIGKYKEVVQENPEYIAALNKLATSCIKMNAEDQAITVFKRIIEINPNNQVAHAKLARLLTKNGSIQEAVKEYKSAISLEADQPDWVFIGLGKALQQSKKAYSA